MSVALGSKYAVASQSNWRQLNVPIEFHEEAWPHEDRQSMESPGAGVSVLETLPRLRRDQFWTTRPVLKVFPPKRSNCTIVAMAAAVDDKLTQGPVGVRPTSS